MLYVTNLFQICDWFDLFFKQKRVIVEKVSLLKITQKLLLKSLGYKRFSLGILKKDHTWGSKKIPHLRF